jgi:hypothetical protein
MLLKVPSRTVTNGAMKTIANSGPKSQAVTLTLDQQLEQLQTSAAVVSRQIHSTNRQFYGHLAELYLWWRGAQQAPDYLETAYAKTGKKYKKKIKQGINFAPLFWLAWGYDNGLTDDKAGRWSRVLNKLHEVYEAEKQYQTDSIPKLQNFIEERGGVDGLVEYGKRSDDDDLEDDDDLFVDGEQRVDLIPGMTVNEMVTSLYGTAKDFYSNLQAPALIDLNATLPVTEDGMSIVLVRKVGERYQLVGAVNDQSMVEPVAMHTYLQDYSALPQSIRTIVETISTQCLPSHLQSFYRSLVDDSPKVAGKSPTKSVRRLMYSHAQGEFILSPIRAQSGVVTIAKPKLPVLEGATRDVFLSTIARRVLEQRLVCGRDFNLYVPSNPDLVPKYRFANFTNVASHAIRLQHQFADRNYLHLDFWPFYGDISMPHAQLVTNAIGVGAGTWHGKLTLAWFRMFSLDFIKLWLSSHGTNIKREHQAVFKLEFSSKALRVDFVYRNGIFENSKTVDLSGAAIAGSAITVCVLSKDFAVAMQAVADLGVVTAVDFAVDAYGLQLTFSTTAADYQVCVPTCTVDGLRSSKHFVSYEPVPVPIDAFESYNDQAEGDFDEAR